MLDYENVVEVDFDDYENDDTDELETYLDYAEDDDDDTDESYDPSVENDSEFFWKRRKRRHKRAKGRGYYTRQLKGLATKKQLRAGLARVGRDIRRLKLADKNISRQVSRVAKSTSRNIKGLKKDVDNTKQMMMLSSLLSGDKKVKVADSSDSTKIPDGTTFTLKDDGDSLDKLLPIIMMGGFGNSSNKSGMMDNPLMMVLLIDALNKN